MREQRITIRMSDEELQRLDQVVRRRLRMGKPADRAAVIRLLVDREHRRGGRKR